MKQSPLVRREFPWYRRTVCWLGLHSGVWQYEGNNSCTQFLYCAVCGGRMIRARHTWDMGWIKGGGIRTCRTCGKTETRGMWKVTDDLCGQLNALGVDATTRRSETGGFLPYFVDIHRSPIRYVEVVEVQLSEGVTFYTAYVIPDSRPVPVVTFRSVRERTFPIFGRVVDVRWQGDDKGSGAIGRLTADLELKAAIISAGAEIAVSSIPSRGWMIQHSSLNAPSSEIFSCYEKAAVDLIGAKKMVGGAR